MRMKEMKKKFIEKLSKGDVPTALGRLEEIIHKYIEKGEYSKAGKLMVLRKEIEQTASIEGLNSDDIEDDISTLYTG